MLDRFMSKVKHGATFRGEPCWEWQGARDRKGYGVFQIGTGRSGRAHRVGYELLVGPVPDGLVLDHLCRVHHCVNPAHLEPVTNAENIARGERATATHCKNGHPFTDERTKQGRRRCRTCFNAWGRAKYAKQKEMV